MLLIKTSIASDRGTKFQRHFVPITYFPAHYMQAWLGDYLTSWLADIILVDKTSVIFD